MTSLSQVIRLSVVSEPVHNLLRNFWYSCSFSERTVDAPELPE